MPVAAPTVVGGVLAAGRFGAWWLLATLGDLTDDWPVDPDELGALAAELRWYRWDAHEPTVGWSLQIAVEDVANDTAWAITARDAVERRSPDPFHS